MKIAILGATGKTGQQLVQQALDDDHDVTAIVRTPSKLNIVHKNLIIVEGNIFSEEDLKKYLQDVDAVVSTLGFPIDSVTVAGFIDVTKCVVKVLREVSCKRLIIVHSWYTHKDARNAHDTDSFRKFISMVSPVLDNMREAEEYLEAECDDIDYTVVSPPGLTDNPKTELAYEVAENMFSVPGANRGISRADVARYILTVLQDVSSYRKIRAISIKS